MVLMLAPNRIPAMSESDQAGCINCLILSTPSPQKKKTEKKQKKKKRMGLGAELSLKNDTSNEMVTSDQID